MDVDAWDSVFVRAGRSDVHALVADPGSWARWWPGVAVEPVGGSAHLLRLPVPGLLRRHQVLAARVIRRRPALGIHLQYRGEVDGEAEFYYLDEPTGSVVTYLLRGRVAQWRWRRTLASHRAAVRRGLESLKDHLEGEREPGAEPDPRLVAGQREAMIEFRRRVEAGRRVAQRAPRKGR